jgi:hypothetical protein
LQGDYIIQLVLKHAGRFKMDVVVFDHKPTVARFVDLVSHARFARRPRRHDGHRVTWRIAFVVAGWLTVWMSYLHSHSCPHPYQRLA